MLAVTSWLAKIGCNIVGNIYPAYASYRAVVDGNAEQHKQWLSYWVVNALFIVAELVADTLISGMPLYYEAKLLLVTWLVFRNGATIAYDKLVHKYITQYEPEIDAKISVLSAQTNQLAGKVVSGAATTVMARSAALMGAISEVAAAAASAGTAAATGSGGGGDAPLASDGGSGSGSVRSRSGTNAAGGFGSSAGGNGGGGSGGGVRSRGQSTAAAQPDSAQR